MQLDSMKTPLRVAVIVLLGGVAFLLLQRFGPGAAQRRGMRAAEEYKAVLVPRVVVDPRFREVELGVMTHPSLRVYGTVPDQRAAEDLKALCKTPEGAPFFVHVQVKIAELK